MGFFKVFENIFGLFIALVCDMKMTVSQFMYAWRVVTWLRVAPGPVRGAEQSDADGGLKLTVSHFVRGSDKTDH